MTCPDCPDLQFGAGTFTAVTIWEYEKVRSKAIDAVKGFNPMGWAQKKLGTSKKQVVG